MFSDRVVARAWNGKKGMKAAGHGGGKDKGTVTHILHNGFHILLQEIRLRGAGDKWSRKDSKRNLKEKGKRAAM